MIQQIQRKTSASRALVLKWYKQFSIGKDSLTEDTECGRSKMKFGMTAVLSIREALEADRPVTIRVLAKQLNIGCRTMQQILRDKL